MWDEAILACFETSWDSWCSILMSENRNTTDRGASSSIGAACRHVEKSIIYSYNIPQSRPLNFQLWLKVLRLVRSYTHACLSLAFLVPPLTAEELFCRRHAALIAVTHWEGHDVGSAASNMRGISSRKYIDVRLLEWWPRRVCLLYYDSVIKLCGFYSESELYRLSGRR
jgi:hypothetical protein